MAKKKDIEAKQGIKNAFNRLFPKNFYVMDLVKYFLVISFISMSSSGFILLRTIESPFELYMISFVFLVSILIAGIIFIKLKTGYFYIASAISFGAIVNIDFLAYSLLLVVFCLIIHFISFVKDG